MKFEINIAKKHAWMIVAAVTLLSVTMLVFATGYSSGLQSHATLFADTIRGKSGGSVTVDDTLSTTGDISADGTISGDGSGLSNVHSSLCMHKRGDSSRNDKVLWCTEDYPVLVHCSGPDDQAPDSVDDLSSECSDDGDCEFSGERGSLGGDYIYFEIIRKITSDGVEVRGCAGYDYEHSHVDYKLDIVCCK